MNPIQIKDRHLYLRKPGFPRSKAGLITLVIYILLLLSMLFVPFESEFLGKLPHSLGLNFFIYLVTFPLGFIIMPFDNLLGHLGFTTMPSLFFLRLFLVISIFTAVGCNLMLVYTLGKLVSRKFSRRKKYKSR